MTTASGTRGVDEGDEDTVIGLGSAESAVPRLREPDDIDGNTIVVTGGVHGRIVASGKLDTAVHGEWATEPETQPSFAMRIGTHSPISLEVPAYIGRRPSTPRITGQRMPRLVMVPSPSREVSSTHAEIRQEADTVVVTDLGSTNGTTVTLPGCPPRKLRQGESLVIGAGAWVDIGDGIRITIERHLERSQTEGQQ